MFRKIAMNGFGAGFPQLALIIAIFIANRQILKYAGEIELAVYSIMLVLSQLFAGVFSGIGQAVQPIATTNYGAGYKQRCKEVYRLGMITTMIFAILFTGICELFPVQTTKLFVDATPEILQATPLITRIYGLSFLGMGVAIYIAMYLQSVMEAKRATIVSLTRGIIALALLLYLLPMVFDVLGIWIAIVAAEVIAAIMAIIFIRNVFKKYSDKNY